MGLQAAADKTHPPVAGRPPEAGDSSAKTFGWHGVSPICAAAFAQIPQGLLCQRVKTTRRDIFLNLTVPQNTVKLGEPPAKHSQLLGGKPANGIFDLFDCAHAAKSTSPTEWDATIRCSDGSVRSPAGAVGNKPLSGAATRSEAPRRRAFCRGRVPAFVRHQAGARRPRSRASRSARNSLSSD